MVAKTVSTIINRKARAEKIDPALFERTKHLMFGDNQATCYAIYLWDGRIHFSDADGEVSAEMIAPKIVWRNGNEEEKLVIGAGASGYLIGISIDLIADAIGDHAEAANLRLLLNRNFDVAVAPDTELSSDLATAFSGIVREMRNAETGSLMILSAYLRIIFVSLWRSAGANESVRHSAGQASEILHRFRQMVEAHFRDHWRVTAYAQNLGITADRLHSISTRLLDRTPLQLVHDRLIYEAQLLLERSGLTIAQVADALGFEDPTHFSHFFKKRAGISPNSYRQAATQNMPDTTELPNPNFADWP